MKLRKFYSLKIKPALASFIITHYKKRASKNKTFDGRYCAFKFVSRCFQNGFIDIKKENDRLNIRNCQKKSIIHIAFIVYTNSMWNVDELYHLLNNNNSFSVDIIVGHFTGLDKTSASIEFEKTFNYFSFLGYNVKKANRVNMHKYDILFYLTPFPFYEKKVNIESIPLKTIVLHSSYSYMISGNIEKINLLMYHFSLRYYADSDYYKQLVGQSKFYTGNALFLGFPKMDQFQSAISNRKIIDKKIIIYAPHHSVNYTKFKSSTFEDNYREILKLAKKYSETTYWIYKPHPLLRTNSVKAGIFSCGEQYDEYETEWEKLQNAKVVNGGNYFELFKCSDAMITDSISFLAEYQFTHKPLLLLESGQEEYNDFGNRIVSILYKCSGKDISGIETFVKNVLSGDDKMYNDRLKFFDENLDYMKDGKTANYKIYQDILKITGKE